MRVIHHMDCADVPWKNGAGRTRELWRQDDAQGGVGLRVSIAEISGSQGFSRFPAMERLILQLDGPAMELTVNGEVHGLSTTQALRFAGEDDVSCRMLGDGLAHDLNLMVNRGQFSASMQVLQIVAGEVLRPDPGAVWDGLLALSAVALQQPESTALSRWSLLVRDSGTDVQFATSGRVVRLSARRVVAA